MSLTGLSNVSSGSFKIIHMVSLGFAGRPTDLSILNVHFHSFTVVVISNIFGTIPVILCITV